MVKFMSFKVFSSVFFLLALATVARADLSMTTATSSADIDVGFNVYLIDASTSSVALQFPDISTLPGTAMWFKRIDSNVANIVTLIVFDSQLMDGATHKELLPNQSIYVLFSDTAKIVVLSSTNTAA